MSFLAQPPELGVEREHAIMATDQHPFPGNLIYRLGRRHVLAAGRYYRPELDAERMGGALEIATMSTSEVNRLCAALDSGSRRRVPATAESAPFLQQRKRAPEPMSPSWYRRETS